MRTRWVSMMAVATMVALCGTAQALDRDASMIDSVGAKLTPFDENDGISVFISGEQAIQNTGGDWAFLLGGQFGTASPSFVDDDDFWSVTAGLKWYVLPPTSVSATFTYGQYDKPMNPDYRSLGLELKQRLLPADAPISPFVTVGCNLYSSDAFYEKDGNVSIFHDEVNSDLAASAGAGIDVSMTEDMVIVIDAGYTESENTDDGWTMGLAMKYYWK